MARGAMQALLQALRKAAADPRKRRALVSVVSLMGLAMLLRGAGRRAALRAAGKTAARAAKHAPAKERMPFSEFLKLVERKEVRKVLVGYETIEFLLGQGDKRFFTNPITAHPGLVELLHDKGIPFDELQAVAAAAPPMSPARVAMMVAVPALYFGMCGLVIKKLYDQTSGGDVGKLSSSGGIGTGSGPGIKRTGFADVAGINAAKEVVEEVADFLKNPESYARTGARLPTGILLIGPPGTGKTMLARAMANESGLPFFFCSGSDFVEIYAGRGASRVRNLFAKAAKAAPCVVFVDEIDALGKSRSSDFSMNEEREQTLNQLLAAMDGFCSEKRIVIMAATNRYDVLDKALVRPGRFDRIVRVDLPDQEGRESILRVHTRHMKLGADCDLALVASLCPDYTGAELSMICNEAAIRAARDKRELLLPDDFLVAIRTHRTSTKRGMKGSRSGSDFMGQLFGNAGVN